jgi:DNA helicase-2/ATP-dependent DNA helicase PcrA
MPDAILEGLNEQQRVAVQQLDGPVLILAGAGSGKTKTLTHRIAYALRKKGLQPENILAVTFTNKAATAMRQRAAHLLGAVDHRGWMPFIGTFHGICVRLLRRDGEQIGVPSDFIIFDQPDATQAVAQAMKQHSLDTKRFNPRSVQSIISNNKNELMSVEDFAPLARTPLQQAVLTVWPTYSALLREAKALDFDDILLKAVAMLETQPSLRKKWQQQFKLIMVDEYQDTNTAQYKLIRLLADAQQNVCVVGDDWQSIYSWRGADYRNILNFERDYPGATVIKLEQNYRSTEAILNAAHNVIAKNDVRSDKKLWTDDKGGRPVTVLPAVDELAEGETVVRLTQAHTAAGGRLRDIAVLYRTNAQSRSLEEQLVRYGTPYKVIGGVRFYDRKEIKDILSYVRLAYQLDDTASFERVVNVPSRGLGARSLQVFNDWRRTQRLTLSQALARVAECPVLTPKATKSLHQFGVMMSDLNQAATRLPVVDFIESVIKRTGYDDFINDGSLQGESRLENIRELVSVAQEYRDADLTLFLEEVALLSDVDSYDQTADAVTLMTLHAAKGLEFPVVMIAGMEEGLFPHSRALFDAEEMEEERRLCYVGMTRAQRELYLLYASRRLLYGNVQHNPPSRFLSDIEESDVSYEPIGGSAAWRNEPTFIPEPTVSVEVGERVQHPVFGVGVVHSVDGDMATIVFKRGAKTLNLAFAPLEKLA